MIDCVHGLGPLHLIFDLLITLPVVGLPFMWLNYKWKQRKCEHELPSLGFMPLHGDNSGMIDVCNKCGKKVKRNYYGGEK